MYAKIGDIIKAANDGHASGSFGKRFMEYSKRPLGT